MNPKMYGVTLLGLAGVSLAPTALVARAEVYMSDGQAAGLILPGQKLARRELALTDAQVATIEKRSDQNVRTKTLTVFVAPDKSAVFIDKVLGKHELITMAVGVGPDGAVRGVEILEYKETYGYQVKNPEWRRQFLGKKADSALKVGSDIRNISGATLSSVHVTNGVKRLVNTYETVHTSL